MLEGFAAFVDPAVCRGLPEVCCAVSVTPLLRELLIRAAHLPALYEEGGANSRLTAVFLDELAAAQVEDLHLPMPTDAPAQNRRSDDGRAGGSGNPGRLGEAGGSQRTDPGASDQPGNRHELRPLAPAARRYACGEMARRRCFDPAGRCRSGYESVPSFVTMFRKALGTSPGRYMAERHAGRSSRCRGRSSGFVAPLLAMIPRLSAWNDGLRLRARPL